MRELAKLSFLIFAAIVWAGAATAASIDLTVISVPNSMMIFPPSETISVEASTDSHHAVASLQRIP
jgi:hypothetical protein